LLCFLDCAQHGSRRLASEIEGDATSRRPNNNKNLTTIHSTMASNLRSKRNPLTGPEEAAPGAKKARRADVISGDDLALLRGLGDDPQMMPAERVIPVLQRNSNAEATCEALRMLVDMVNTEATCKARVAMLAVGGAIAAAIAALKAHADNVPIQQHGLLLLSNLARDDEGEAAVLAAGGAIAAAIVTLKVHAGNSEVQSNGLSLLSNLACSGEGKSAVLAMGGAIDVAAAALEAHAGNANVQRDGLRLLSHLWANGDTAVRPAAGGTIATAVAALVAHVGNAAVQQYGLLLLSHLLANGDEGKAAVLMAGGAIAAAVAALNAHAEDSKVQGNGLLLLARLAYTEGEDTGEGKAAVLAAGGATTAIAALQAHTSDAYVQKQGLHLLANLAYSEENGMLEDDDIAKRWLEAHGGWVSAAVAALKIHKGDAVVQLQGLELLSHLTCEIDGELAVLAADGAVTAAVAALKAHAGNAAVQSGSLCVLGNLFHGDTAEESSAGRTAVLSADGAIVAAVAALKTHADHAGVQSHGLRLLGNLAWGAEGEAAVLAAGGAIAAAVAALDTELEAPAGVSEVAESREWLLLNISPVDLMVSGAVQALFRANSAGGLVRHVRTTAEGHQDMRMLRAAMRVEHSPGLLESAQNATLALLYLGDDDAVKAGFAPGGVGLRQLRGVLAADTPATRLSGARAVAHLLERMKLTPQLLSAGASSEGAEGAEGAIHSFAAVFDSEEDSDLCFEVEGRTLHAHRVLLKRSLGTDIFAAMLSHGTSESCSGRVKVGDVSFEVFSLVVQFLYTGKADVPPKLLLAVFRAARRWMVDKLLDLCAAQLSARCVAWVSEDEGDGEQGAAGGRWEWEGVWELLELVSEVPSGDAAECLQLAASRCMLRHVEALVEQERFVQERVELADLLLGHAYPQLLRDGVEPDVVR
jgi:hypothetical protein